LVDGFFNFLLAAISTVLGWIPTFTIGETYFTPSYSKTGAALAGLFGVFADKIDPLVSRLTGQATEFFAQLLEKIGLSSLASILGI
jgi:hypothetical protein